MGEFVLEFSRVIYMNENKKPHNRIAELRKEKSLTLQQVADAIGVGNNTISRYETGNRKPSEKALTKISNLFRVPVPYLQGNGWSQDDAIWLLIYVYVNKEDDLFELPSGVFSDYGNIYKYGQEKESFQNFYSEAIPGFYQTAKGFLMINKRDNVIHDYLNYYHVGKHDSFDLSNLDEYIRNNFSDLANKYLSSDELQTIRKKTLDRLKNRNIHLPTVLEGLISKKFLSPLDDFVRNYKLKQENEDSTISIKYIKTSINKAFFKDFKKEALSNIKSLNDYIFLSSIGENYNSTGVTPEYEIVKKLSNDLDFKHFQARQDYFKENPYKASDETIKNMVSLSEDDRSSLMDIIDYLLGQNDEMSEKLEELSTRVEELEHPERFNKDYDD